MGKNGKQTSSSAARAASKVLRGNYSSAAKKAAGSALSQTPSKRRGK
jgi:hypothetical protein